MLLGPDHRRCEGSTLVVQYRERISTYARQRNYRSSLQNSHKLAIDYHADAIHPADTVSLEKIDNERRELIEPMSGTDRQELLIRQSQYRRIFQKPKIGHAQ